MTIFAVLFDGPSGEHAPPQDGGSLGSLGHLMEKFLKTIRANPEKAESLYGEFEKVVDGPSGEHASQLSLGLGDEEMQLVEKFLKIVRANPDKAEKMVEEEEKDQDGSGANLSRQPPLMRSQRTVESKVNWQQ